MPSLIWGEIVKIFRQQIPAAGIEPALPKEHDFESRASTNSATPACCLRLLKTQMSSNSGDGVNLLSGEKMSSSRHHIDISSM